MRNIKLQGCGPVSPRVFVLAKVGQPGHRYRRRYDPKEGLDEMKVFPLESECQHCGAAPGWGCFVRHNRRRTAELGRELTPLHLGSLAAKQVAGVAVHDTRYYSAVREARLGFYRRYKKSGTPRQHRRIARGVVEILMGYPKGDKNG